MKQALKCLTPPLLCGGFATLVFSERLFYLPFVWMIFYGLALLATAPFAPCSIPRLGWVFLLTGLVTFCFRGKSALADPNLLMVATFGLFHLVYSAFTWPRRGSVGGTP
jgi:hypothetical protein